MSVALVAYESGNLGSVVRAFGRVGVTATVARSPEDIGRSTHVLLPGVGAFGAAMNILRRDGWDEALRTHVAKGLPLLGICLGMQLLASEGTERGPCEGLGLIPGRVSHLSETGCQLRIPHVGWNDVRTDRGAELTEGIAPGTDFYFAHSYVLTPEDPDHVLGVVEYQVPITAMVMAGTTFGIQFHPEKSSIAGLRLLENFSRVRPC